MKMKEIEGVSEYIAQFETLVNQHNKNGETLHASWAVQKQRKKKLWWTNTKNLRAMSLWIFLLI